MVENIFSAKFTIRDSVWIALIVITGYFSSRCVYNLYFHPLRKFPGPKLAAIGSFLEFYYDVVKDGTYLWQIEKMHLKYGPIVRVNARELHIMDPHFYKDIYAGSGRRVDKDPVAVAAYTVPQAILATVNHDLHRLRRGLLSSYFSKRSIVSLEPTIHERVGRLCTRLEECMHQAQVVDLDCAFAALTADIVTCYFYGSHLDYLGNQSFKFAVRDAILGLIGFYHLTRFLPTLASIIKKLPIAVIQLINPGAADMLRFQADIERDIQSSLDDGNHGDDVEKPTKPKAVIVEALKDSHIHPEERTIHRMVDEGTTIIFAGTETTARALSVGMFHLLNNKSLLQELRKELMSLPPVEDHAYQLSQLENLPYLSGVVNEGLRLSHGPVIRLPRVAVTEALKYKDYVIPPGTPVSQLTYLVHMDASIFPNPHSFDPTRWIRAAKEGVKLEKFLVSFTKGSRICLGINLAYAEIYLTVARIALSFNMELRDTTQDDLDIHHIRLTGYPKKGTGEVKAMVTEKIGAKVAG